MLRQHLAGNWRPLLLVEVKSVMVIQYVVISAPFYRVHLPCVESTQGVPRYITDLCLFNCRVMSGSRWFRDSPIRLRQNVNGIHWLIEGESPERRESTGHVSQYWVVVSSTSIISNHERLKVSISVVGGNTHYRILVFLAHPELHRFPWSVPYTVANADVWRAICGKRFTLIKAFCAQISSPG